MIEECSFNLTHVSIVPNFSHLIASRSTERENRNVAFRHARLFLLGMMFSWLLASPAILSAESTDNIDWTKAKHLYQKAKG